MVYETKSTESTKLVGRPKHARTVQMLAKVDFDRFEVWRSLRRIDWRCFLSFPALLSVVEDMR